MPRLMWALLCERIITDAETNKVSYIDATEELVATELPMPLPDLFVGTVWSRTKLDEKVRMRVRLVSPTQEELVNFEIPALEMRHERHRINLNLRGVPMAAVGTYEVIVEQLARTKWHVASNIPLQISLNEIDAEAE